MFGRVANVHAYGASGLPGSESSRRLAFTRAVYVVPARYGAEGVKPRCVGERRAMVPRAHSPTVVSTPKVAGVAGPTTGSLNVTVIGSDHPTPAAPSAGSVAVTPGGVLSIRKGAEVAVTLRLRVS